MTDVKTDINVKIGPREVLPCPFCGGPARTFHYNGTMQAGCATEYIDCAGAGCDAPIAMWNRRAGLANQTVSE